MTMFPKIYGLENSKIYQKSLARNLKKLIARLRGWHTFGTLVLFNYEIMAFFSKYEKSRSEIEKKDNKSKIYFGGKLLFLSVLRIFSCQLALYIYQ